MRSWTKENITGYVLLSPLYLSSYILFKTPFEFYLSYLPIILLLPFFTVKFGVPKALVGILAVFLLTSFFGIVKGQNEVSDLMKIWINISVSALYFYHILNYFNLDVIKLFKLYLNIAFFISLLGIIQVFSYSAGLVDFYTFFGIFNKWGVSEGGIFGIRLNSIYSEPSYFGSAIGPAFFIAIFNVVSKPPIFLSKVKSAIIIVAYFLTFSTVSYLGIFLIFILILLNFGLLRYILFAIPVLIGSYYYLYNNVTEFKIRIDGITSLASGQTVSAFDVHGSSFVLYNNYTIAKQNILRNPLFGSGLGSHQHAYQEFSLVKDFGGIYDFNSQDANSMLLRIASETGLLGLSLVVFFITTFFLKRNEDDKNEIYWMLSSACLVIIFLQLLRQGNYTYNGFFFFVWMYYFIRKVHDKEQISQLSDRPVL